MKLQHAHDLPLAKPQLVSKPLAHGTQSASAPHFVVEASQGWVSLQLSSLWEYRELFYFLVWRDLKVRYKQTALGVVWVILQPLAFMLLFSLFFGYLARLPSDGVPYPIFAYAALLPWQLFANALTASGHSLVANQELLKKVYFPRLLIPLSSACVGLLDFAISFFVLLGLMAYYGLSASVALVTLPLFVVLALATAMAVGLWLSALNVQYRDVQFIIPFLTQFWFFSTPIAYSSTLIPDAWRPWYGLNPMVGVIDGFRWSLLGQSAPLGISVAVSSIVTLLLLISGLVYFRRMERSFADIV